MLDRILIGVGPNNNNKKTEVIGDGKNLWSPGQETEDCSGRALLVLSAALLQQSQRTDSGGTPEVHFQEEEVEGPFRRVLSSLISSWKGISGLREAE